MLFTLLPGANSFQGIIGDPEDWVQDIITNMVKKTARRVTDGMMNTATSSLLGLVSSNCQNLFPSLGLLIFTLYFFCLNGFMTVLEFLMNFFSKPQTRDPDHEDEKYVDYTPSAPPLEQLRSSKQRAPPPPILQVILVPPTKFQDPARETLVHGTMVTARTNTKPKHIPVHILLILITFFLPLAVGFSDVFQERMASDTLTVSIGGSVTLQCKEHTKYGGKLKWSMLDQSKPLPVNSLVRNNDLHISNMQVGQESILCQTTKGRLRWTTEFVSNVLPETIPGAVPTSEFPTNIEALISTPIYRLIMKLYVAGASREGYQ